MYPLAKAGGLADLYQFFPKNLKVAIVMHASHFHISSMSLKRYTEHPLLKSIFIQRLMMDYYILKS